MGTESLTRAPRRNRLGRAALVALAIFVVGCAAQAVRVARRTIASCHPARARLRAEDHAAARDAFPSLEEVSFRTKDGITLRGWRIPSKNRAAVILVHGGGGNRAHWMPELRALADRGYGALAYDSRACGESDGDLVTAGDRERADVVAALDLVTTSADVDPARVGLVGFSYGASAVLLVAATDTRARAVLVGASWTSLEDELTKKSGKFQPIANVASLWAMRHEGVRVDDVRPIDHVAEISPRPLFLVTGDLDTDTPVAVVRALLDAARMPKELWIVPGAGHGDYAAVSPAEVPRRFVAFFDGALLR